jgi:hypothetical protein
MAELDKAKENIGILKVYLALLTALIMGDISGTVKLFMADKHGLMFWIGIFALFVLVSIFVMLAKYTHRKINELEEIL